VDLQNIHKRVYALLQPRRRQLRNDRTTLTTHIPLMTMMWTSPSLIRNLKWLNLLLWRWLFSLQRLRTSFSLSRYRWGLRFPTAMNRNHLGFRTRRNLFRFPISSRLRSSFPLSLILGMRTLLSLFLGARTLLPLLISYYIMMWTSLHFSLIRHRRVRLCLHVVLG
jgi:hypothetical protein